LPSSNIKRRISLQVFDLKDCSLAWAKAFFLKRILALRAGATLFSCAWHQRLPSSRGDGPARLIKFNRAFFGDIQMFTN
jgi:hypothetical protein